MATAAACNALTTYYVKGFTEKYGAAPVVNRNIARSQFANMLIDYSSKQVKELIDYYFTTSGAKNHDLTWFFYNYDKLIRAKKDADEDNDARQRVREESKKRVKEWRERGRQGITND